MKSLVATGMTADQTYDWLLSNAIDIIGAKHVEFKTRGNIVWVNVNGVCVLRISKIEHLNAAIERPHHG